MLDRITGEFLSATPFARQNWAKEIDARGRPVPNPETVPNLKGAVVYPDDDGSANWFSPSYSPQTNLFYQNVREKGQVYFRTDAAYESGRMFTGAAHRGVAGEEPWGALRALDALPGERGGCVFQNPPPRGG